MHSTFIILEDPLHHSVLLKDNRAQGGDDDWAENVFSEYQKVIKTPAFLIEGTSEDLYYFRQTDWESTLLIEAKGEDGLFIARNFVENPTVEYVAQLLKKGTLKCFGF